ncbi:hypothetical protein VTO73DRAFT_3758 [Trametes versicolor]
MEYLQARLDSFASSKSKRTKASTSKHSSASTKWPHPPTWKATPTSLAEAGFYHDPSSSAPDNVTCFMCKKSLCGWEPEDDPFEIHYEKCSEVCGWAVVRCQKPDTNGKFDFSDSTRHPTSKEMEKARLDTFSQTQWPHDGVRGHGANSKALAKAGFVWNASEPGDDTAMCLYCNLSLGGWDAEDDPYEEHLKRDKKHKTACAFLKAFASTSLSKSTSKRAPPKAASRKLSRSVSQTIQNTVTEAPEEESDDELAVAPSSGTAPSRGPSGRASKSRSSRASSAPAKTPASRRSTRGTGTSGKTPGSKNTVSSEVDETDGGSESETGKRVSKSKRKTGGRAKARVSAIVEEDVEEDVPRRTQPHDDVEMEEQEEVLDAAKEGKRKRGRPPKNAVAAKPASRARTKKVLEPEETEGASGTDNEPAPAPPPKKAHTRTRSKANLDSETEAPALTAPKPTHTRTKSGTKAKVKQEQVEEEIPAPAPAAPKRKGKQKAASVAPEEDEDVDVPPPPPKAKGKGRAPSSSRPKAKAEPQPIIEDDLVPSHDEPEPEPPRERTQTNHSTSSRPSKVPSKRTPSLSDDAGYATAEPPADAERMDVDGDEPPLAPPSKQPLSRKAGPSGSQRATQGTVSRSTPQSVDGETTSRPSSALNGITRQSAAPPSRASSARPISRVPSTVNRSSLKVIDIDSDGEEGPVQAPPPKPKAVERTVSLNGMKKPPSKTPAKKLQVEVVLPSRTKPPSQETEDVRMQEPSPTSPVRPKAAHSSSPVRAARKPDTPDTPVSAVHRSAQVSPARPPHHASGVADDDVAMPDFEPAASTSPRTYHPVLAQVPIEKLTGLTEEEANMTLEEYIRRETELQYAQFKADAERKIDEFKRKAAEAKQLIETA